MQRWGEPRITEDVDLTLLTGFKNEELFIDELLRHFKPRLSDAKEFALANRVLLLETDEGIGIDVSLGGIPFEEQVVDRATPFEFLPEISLLTCSAEDLIVLKAFADRPRDWEDVAGIVIRQQILDWGYINSQLQPLVELKESPHILERLSQLQQGR
ncbi:MAG: nucleotidyl transferase AbiEii/AbiGii toxin family protein [Pirellulales bacterium]|nr:nucleotidyl transferase AbiEii/AbiGii toxin family protein [Pirellulales bacterium]